MESNFYIENNLSFLYEKLYWAILRLGTIIIKCVLTLSIESKKPFYRACYPNRHFMMD